MSAEANESQLSSPFRPAGTVVPWPEQRRDLPAMTGDEQLVERTWTEIDAWTYAFLWHCVVSF